MADAFGAAGARPESSKYATLAQSRQFSGLFTQRPPFGDPASSWLQQKFYAAQRFDAMIDGLNREISARLTDIRSPGTSPYGVNLTDALSFYVWKYIQNSVEICELIADTAASVNSIGQNGSISPSVLWSKSAAGVNNKSRFLGVNTELFFNDTVEPKKVLQSALIWEASTIYDSLVTSDEPLGDYIIDTNSNVQQAVGGFNLVFAQDTSLPNPLPAVQINSNVLTLQLDNGTLPDPTGTPTGTGSSAYGAMTTGTHYARICAVDENGYTTEAGSESAAVTLSATGKVLWQWPAVAGAKSYQIYVSKTAGGEASYFTSNVNSFSQTQDTSQSAGTPPVSNTTSVNLPENLYAMVGVKLALSGFSVATFLNGQTITIASVTPNGTNPTAITAAFTHASFTSATDQGTGTTGTGITGTTQPTWATTLGAVTQDGGAQWINRGPNLQNWGIAKPANPPSVFQTANESSAYESWAANTGYWRSRCIRLLQSGEYNIYQLTTSGTTGSTAPSWNYGSVGATTTDGTCVWTFKGSGYNFNTAYAKGYCTQLYSIFGPQYTYNTIFQALNAGTSGDAINPNWGTVAAQVAGTTQADNDITWECLGFAPNAWPGANLNLSAAETVVDSNGYLQEVQDNQTFNGGGFQGTCPTTGSEQVLVTMGAVSGGYTITGIQIGAEGTATFGAGYTFVQAEAVASNPATVGVPAIIQALVSGGAIISFSVIYGGDYTTSTPPSIVLQTVTVPTFSGSVQPSWGATDAVSLENYSAVTSNGSIVPATGSNIAFLGPGDIGSLVPQGQAVTVAGITNASFTGLNGPQIQAAKIQSNLFGGNFAFETTTAEAALATFTAGLTWQIPLWVNIGAYVPATTATRMYGYSYGSSVTGHIGTSSLPSGAVTTPGNYFDNIAGIGSPDSQVDTIWLWATVEGGSTLIYMDQIANPGGGAPFTYQRTGTDADLNALIAAPVNDANNPPPVNCTAFEDYLSRNWYISNNKVGCSGVDQQPVGAGRESFDPANVWPLTSQPIRLKGINVQGGGLLVFTTAGIYIILGNGTANDPFILKPYYRNVGILSYDAFAEFNQALFVMEGNSKVSMILPEYPFNPQTGYLEIGFAIGDQFDQVTTGGFDAALFNPATSYLTWNNEGTAESALYVGDGAGHWFRMSQIAAPESGFAWSPIRSLEQGGSCMASLETSPGQYQLLIGPASGASGPVVFRDSTVNTDWVVTEGTGAATPYPAWDVKGSIVLASTGEVAEIAAIGLKSAAVGARPTVGILLDEIGTGQPFDLLQVSSNDPPNQPASESYFSDRYLTSQTGTSPKCDNFQLKVDYGTQAVADELYGFAIYGAKDAERKEQ